VNCKPLARKKLNNDSKFAMFYISVISIALGASLYVNRLNGGWNHAVFTFPPEVQKVVENGTAVMEVQWRWLPETLEIMVKVNDDEINATTHPIADGVVIIFDSDNNGKLTSGFDNYDLENFNDHGVFLLSEEYVEFNSSTLVIGHCWVDSKGHIYPALLSGVFFEIASLDNTTTCTFKEGEGYTFNTSIPIKYISVKSPTQVIINYVDEDYRYQKWGEYQRLGKGEVDEAFLVAQLWM